MQIMLINPISGRGHLDAYARLYSRAMIELGHDVILCANSDGQTTRYLDSNGCASKFRFVTFDEVSKFLSSLSTPQSGNHLNRIMKSFISRSYSILHSFLSAPIRNYIRRQFVKVSPAPLLGRISFSSTFDLSLIHI